MDPSQTEDSDTRSLRDDNQFIRGNTHSALGWTADTELVRAFHRPVDVGVAVSTAVEEAIDEWAELSETPSLDQFVDVEKLSGLFKTQATDDSELPAAEFQFQNCWVTVLYGSTVRVIIERD